MSENPYQYHEEQHLERSVPDDGSACRFPKTPFVISLKYRRHPCTLTVFADHLLIKGEKLQEPIRVERHEKICSRFWSVIPWGDLALIVRNRKYKFKVRREPQIFMKLGWLEAWNQRFAEPFEAAEKARRKSENLILWIPKLMTLILVCEFSLLAIIYFMKAAQTNFSTAARFLWVAVLLLAMSSIYSFWGLMQRSRIGLLPIPAMMNSCIAFLIVFQAIRYFFHRDVVLSSLVFDSLIFSSVGCFFISIYYLPYRQLKRLDRQIHETQEED